MRSRIIPFVLLSLTACATGGGSAAAGRSVGTVAATGPEFVTIVNETDVVSNTLGVPPAEVWPALVEAFESIGLEATRQSRAEGVVAADRFRLTRLDGHRASWILDCGSNISGQIADQSYITASVVTSLSAAPEQGTVLSTEVVATARARGSATGEVFCRTRGRLEDLIVRRVSELLVG